VSQLLLDEDRSRVGRLVLTNCDAFETFPPAPFGALFRAARHPGLTRALLQPMRSSFLRHSRLGFGGLVRRRLDTEESRPWVTPYLTDPGVRRDVTTFANGWRPDELVHAASWLETFDRPVLLCWAPGDPFFKHALAKRLLSTFPDATLVEFRGARTFVSLDQPERLAEEIVRWLH
jgi:pimeloyl-ACP methyl ester carboxylesterase